MSTPVVGGGSRRTDPQPVWYDLASMVSQFQQAAAPWGKGGLPDLPNIHKASEGDEGGGKSGDPKDNNPKTESPEPDGGQEPPPPANYSEDWFNWALEGLENGPWRRLWKLVSERLRGDPPYPSLRRTRKAIRPRPRICPRI